MKGVLSSQYRTTISSLGPDRYPHNGPSDQVSGHIDELGIGMIDLLNMIFNNLPEECISSEKAQSTVAFGVGSQGKNR